MQTLSKAPQLGQTVEHRLIIEQEVENVRRRASEQQQKGCRPGGEPRGGWDGSWEPNYIPQVQIVTIIRCYGAYQLLVTAFLLSGRKSIFMDAIIVILMYHYM